MGDFIDWANENAGLLSLVFAFVVAISAATTAWFNRRLASETAQLRKAETDPRLAIYLDLRRHQHGFIDIVLRNIGRGAAYDLSFTLDPVPEVETESHIGKLNYLQSGVKFLAPDQELRTFAGTFRELFRNPISVKADYSNKPTRRFSRGQRYSENFELDAQIFDGMHTVGETPEQQIAKSLKSIEQSLNRFGDDFNPHHVHIDSIRRRPEPLLPLGSSLQGDNRAFKIIDKIRVHARRKG